MATDLQQVRNPVTAAQAATTTNGGGDNFFVHAPTLSVPKGGGAVKSIDEKFQVNAVNGTAGVSIPLPLSQGRGFYPSLNLSYNSGAGNGIFGLGWSLSLQSIKRKTDKRLPCYEDATDLDIFLFSEAEDLVPELQHDNAGNIVADAAGRHVIREHVVANKYLVRRFRPRIEGLFAKIERWTEIATGLTHWRVTTKENITSIFGRDSNSRIVDDPIKPKKCYQWLIDFVFDCLGNCIKYNYKQEDKAGMDMSALHNRNRSSGAISQRYLKTIQYGNIQMHKKADDPEPAEWMFESVFDYGEHDPVNIPYGQYHDPATNQPKEWDFRADAFSDYKAGFEIRTCRLCRRVLLYHHFPELPGGHALIKEVKFDYETSLPGFTLLTKSTLTGFTKHDDNSYTSQSLPPLQFHYQAHEWNTEVKNIMQEDLLHAPAGIDDQHYQFTDLYNEGLNGILSAAPEAWYYKNNLGNGKFEPAELIEELPSMRQLGSDVQLADLEANGSKQLMTRVNGIDGFFQLNADNTWSAFQTFESIPNIDWKDPHLKFFDVNGDGQPEIVLTGEQAFTIYASEGKKGFAPSKVFPKETDEEKGPAIVFSDNMQSIFLADMSGDGLTDLVRIRNGETCYWPNLGYGSFGAKVNMDNSPWFDATEDFNPAFIKLADVDGSGITDILYITHSNIQIYLNQSGNAFVKSKNKISFFPDTNNMVRVTASDLLGTGATCLVWNNTLPGNAQFPLRYIDLVNSKKPHLLIGFDNNLGKSVNLEYTPSTNYYIRDKMAGTPWITKLHFPVHCVSKVTTTDWIAKTRFAKEYTYHHGYYDHGEREFRGFGRVDETDAEEIQHFKKDNAGAANNTIADPLHQSPVLTKTWYHTGAFTDHEKILGQFAHEYFQNAAAPEHRLQEPTLTQGISLAEWREAARACKGSALRTEIYALDGSQFQQYPYSVNQKSWNVKLLQPKATNEYAVFSVHPCEELDYIYERDPSDPRIEHDMTLETDTFGNITRNAKIVYPRMAHNDNYAEQDTQHVLYNEMDYTNAVDDVTGYRTPGPVSTKSFEVTGIPEGSFYAPAFIFTQCQNAKSLDYEQATGNVPEKRIIEYTRIRYRGDDTKTVLPFGQQESKGLVHQSYKAAANKEMLRQVFDVKKPVDELHQLLTAPGQGAYEFSDNYYWLQSGIQEYDETKFYNPVSIVTPFGGKTIIEFDKYCLFTKQITDPVGNTDEITQYNYRVLAPLALKDENDNVSAVRFNELGMVIRSFMVGKKGVDRGDEFDDTKIEIKGATDAPSTEIFYVVSNWFNQVTTPNFDSSRLQTFNYIPQPNFTHTRSRDRHYHADAAHATSWHEVFSYVDGAGRVLLTKMPAEPGLAIRTNPDGTIDNAFFTNTRWTGNGRIIVNNKGNPVKKYEPYFAVQSGFDDEKDMVELGVTPLLFYDPLGRNIKTELPDQTFTRIEFSAWWKKEYDANDTVVDSAWYAANGSPAANGPEPGDPLTRSAWLAAKQYNTPTLTVMDSLGRPFLTRSTDLANECQHHSTLDIEGNLRQLKDALNRPAITYVYNMLGDAWYHSSFDSGKRWIVKDIAGNPIMKWDDRDNEFSFRYDVARRNVAVFMKEGNAVAKQIESIEYGEAQGTANNLKNKIHKHYDQSGIITNKSFDFKQNLLQTSRTLSEEYEKTIDWSAPAAIQLSDEYISSKLYDAHNKPLQISLSAKPGTPATRVFPVYNNALMLEKLEVDIRGTGRKEYVSNIDYNAKGQREKIQYANGVVTKYSYEKETFRLRELLTTNNGTILQRLLYTYDPIGNITTLRNMAEPDVVFRNDLVKALQQFEYDGLYRLVRATGREHAGQTVVNHSGRQGNYRDHPFSLDNVIGPNELTAFYNYTEKYVYNKAGNMMELEHTSHNPWKRTNEYSNGNNQLTKTTVAGFSQNYTYNAHGGILAMEHLDPITWDYSDRLKEISLKGGGNAYYTYDSKGERVRKITKNGNLAKQRIYLEGIEIYREFNNGIKTLERETVHILDDQRRVGLIDLDIRADNSIADQWIRYQLDNHIASSCIELDETAKIITKEEYYPFGTTSYSAVPYQRQVPDKRYRYIGKERDDETGFNYHGARYYIPWLHRWASTDPSGIRDHVNLYQYCQLNPVKYVDTDGNESADWTKSLSWSQRAALWIDDKVGSQNIQHAANFSAGMGDTLSFGATKVVRNLQGTDGFVQTDSKMYRGGQVAGEVTKAVITGTPPAAAVARVVKDQVVGEIKGRAMDALGVTQLKDKVAAKAMNAVGVSAQTMEAVGSAVSIVQAVRGKSAGGKKPPKDSFHPGTYGKDAGHHVHQSASYTTGPQGKNPNHRAAVTVPLKGKASDHDSEHGRATTTQRGTNQGLLGHDVDEKAGKVTITATGDGRLAQTHGATTTPTHEDLKAYYALQAAGATKEQAFAITQQSAAQIERAGVVPRRVPTR